MDCTHTQIIGFTEKRMSSLLDRLTPKQIQILARILAGENPKQIAHGLGNSLSTIYQNYNATILRLGCKNRNEVIAKFTSPSYCAKCMKEIK
jgi:DNA-binding CsgD family transcriptional regulator